MHYKLVFLSIITLLTITIVSFQNCSRRGSGIKPLVTPDPPLIGTIVASWYEESGIVEDSSPARAKIQEAKSYMSEPIPNNRFESHSHPIDVGTEVTLEFKTSDEKVHYFWWSIQKGFEVIKTESTEQPKYHYQFEEPGIYDVSVMASALTGGPEEVRVLSESLANKRLIIGQCSPEFNDVAIPEIISDSVLAPGKNVTLSLQDTSVESDRIDPPPSLQYNDFNDIQWKVTIPYSDTCKGLCTKIGKEPERIEKTGESITVDIPEEDNRFVASHIEVEVTAKVNPTNPSSVSIGPDGQQVEYAGEPLPACITYRKKDFKVDDMSQSQFIAVKPVVQIENEMVCTLLSPPSCDSSPEFGLEHLSLENNDIYRYKRNTNGLKNQVVIDARNVIALDTCKCGYKIIYQHNQETEEGLFSCDNRVSETSELSCTHEERSPPLLTLDSSQACHEALITIIAGEDQKIYYNYCPESDNEFGICYFGPVDHRPESHKCSSSSSPPPFSTTTTTTTN